MPAPPPWRARSARSWRSRTSSISERVSRAILAMGWRARVSAGSARCARVPSARGRHPAELDREEDDQHEPQPEVRRGLAQQGEPAAHVVEPAVPEDRGEHPERDRDQHDQGGRGPGQGQGRRDPLQHDAERRHAELEASCRSSRPRSAQEQRVLGGQRQVEPQRAPDGLVLLLRALRAEQHGGGVAGQPEDDEHERHHPPDRDDRTTRAARRDSASRATLDEAGAGAAGDRPGRAAGTAAGLAAHVYRDLIVVR